MLFATLAVFTVLNAPLLSQSAKKHYKFGVSFEARGQYLKALEHYEKAVGLRPSKKRFAQKLKDVSHRVATERAEYALALPISRLYEQKESLAFVENYAPAHPFLSDLRLLIGFRSLEVADLQEAIRYADSVLASDETNQRALELQGLAKTVLTLLKPARQLIAEAPPSDLLSGLEQSLESGHGPVEEFTKHLETIHSRALQELSRRLRLTEEQEKAALSKLVSRRHDIAERYLTQVREYRASLEAAKRELNHSEFPAFVKYEATHSIQAMSEALAGFICPLALSFFKQPDFGLLDTPCQFVVSALLHPYLSHLREAGIIHDYATSRTLIRGHVRNLVAELTTVRDRIFVDIDRELIREFLIFESRADVSVRFNGFVLAGFDLGKGLDVIIDEVNGRFKILLPQPEVLAVEATPAIESLSQGWLVRIGVSDINSILRGGRQEIEKKAIDSGILDEAKENVAKVLREFLRPLTDTSMGRLELEVQFAGEQVELILPKG